MAETPDVDQQVFYTGEAARFLGVSRRTLTRYAAKGLITPERLPSGYRRWRRVDLQALLEPAA